jgi:hypothetical protein
MHKLRDIESRTGTVVDLEIDTTGFQHKIDTLKHHEVLAPPCCLAFQFHCDQESVCSAIALTDEAACIADPNVWGGCESPSCHHQEVDVSSSKTSPHHLVQT